MKKRQVKKFAKNAKKNMTPYREAANRGSKKHVRRHRAFGRYLMGGLSTWNALRLYDAMFAMNPWGAVSKDAKRINDVLVHLTCAMESYNSLVAAITDPRVLAGEAVVEARVEKPVSG